MANDHMDYRALKIGLFAIFLFLSFATIISAQDRYYFAIGAIGDDGSKGNLGAQVEIRTKSYYGNVYTADDGVDRATDSFVLGEHFDDGSVIYFGYDLYAEHAQWFWQRLSSGGVTEDEGMGFVDSVEPNGTWHSYSVLCESQCAFAQRTWDFYLDGHPVASTQQSLDESRSIAGSINVFALKWTDNFRNMTLGPVEFRNLAYLKPGGWHDVASLRVWVSCLNVATRECDVEFPYGVMELGANHIIAGTGMPKHSERDLLWTTNPVEYVIPYVTPVALVVFVLVLSYFAIRRRIIVNPNWKPRFG